MARKPKKDRQYKLRLRRASQTALQLPESGSNSQAESAMVAPSNEKLAQYANELEAEVDALKDALIDMRMERDLVLKSISEIVKDATRFDYYVREEVGQLDSSDAQALGPIAGRLKFFLDAMPRALSDAGISISHLIGVEYSPGLTVEAINLDEFGPNDELEIVDVIEPLLTYSPKHLEVSDEVQPIKLRVGKVLVSKKDS